MLKHLLLIILFSAFSVLAQSTYDGMPDNWDPTGIPDRAKTKILRASPKTASVTPKKPRTLLVTNFHFNDKKVVCGHPSIPYSNFAIRQMAKNTGAYKVVFSNDTLMFKKENLKNFDAVCFNNTAGVLFEDKQLRRNLLEFVYSGGGFMGIHAAGATFCQWPEYGQFPEFGKMLGGYENGGHPWGPDDVITLEVEEPGHPLNAGFPMRFFRVMDEVFQFKDHYSREKLRILLTINTGLTDMSEDRRILPERRADGDLAISWVRQYGRGRVFYTSLGHNAHINWDTIILQHYLDAIQFVLGDLDAPVTPSAKLTPAVQAREQLGVDIGFAASKDAAKTLFQAIEAAAQHGIYNLSSVEALPVTAGKPAFSPLLSDDDLWDIRFKLLDAGVRLKSYKLENLPGSEDSLTVLLDFCRKMGMETVICNSGQTISDIAIKYAADRNMIILQAFRSSQLKNLSVSPRSVFVFSDNCHVVWPEGLAGVSAAPDALTQETFWRNIFTAKVNFIELSGIGIFELPGSVEKTNQKMINLAANK
ncbi:ThuA domain-containing protein [candidate division KSB1 bacterium]|nr:ThuA domain-containing protein [candidate division KSB1 bacterium]